MATTGALGKGPISFFVSGTGNQVSIPLSALIFNGGQLQLSPAASSLATGLDPTKLSSWLNYVAAQGLIVPAPTAPPAQALIFTAADPGVTGNDVTVTIVSGPTGNQFTATVTKTDVYPNLNATNIGTVLGAVAPAPPSPGTGPGLLRVSDASKLGAVPSGTATGVTSTDNPAKVTFTFSPTNSLALVASKSGAASQAVVATITPTDASGNTFTLTITWKAVIPVNPGVATWVADFNSAASYVLSVTAPPAPLQAAPPQAGVYVLSGGSNAAPATPATATALASS